MGDIVNLKLARKRKARIGKEERAEANRVLFGRTKAEKLASDAERRRNVASLDAHKREPDADQ